MDKVDIGSIFDRICAAKGITQADLGKRFNKSPQSMAQHRQNNTFDLRLLIEAFPDVSLDWLFRGHDPLQAARGALLEKGYRVTLEPIPAPQAPPGAERKG